MFKPKIGILICSWFILFALLSVCIGSAFFGIQTYNKTQHFKSAFLMFEVFIGFLLFSILFYTGIRKFIFYSFYFEKNYMIVKSFKKEMRFLRADIQNAFVDKNSCRIRTKDGKTFHIKRDYKDFDEFKERFKRFYGRDL